MINTIIYKHQSVTSITIARKSYEEILEACAYLVDHGYLLDDSITHEGAVYIAKFIKREKENTDERI